MTNVIQSSECDFVGTTFQISKDYLEPNFKFSHIGDTLSFRLKLNDSDQIVRFVKIRDDVHSMIFRCDDAGFRHLSARIDV